MLWRPKTMQNLAMYNVFFIFGRFSIAGKLPKWPKIPFQYPLALRHPKILEKCRKHHRILVSVRNRFWPPPAKADIATAILTNVIEHLVLLLPPNKHAFTAKAVWADFFYFFPTGLKNCELDSASWLGARPLRSLLKHVDSHWADVAGCSQNPGGEAWGHSSLVDGACLSH